MATTLEDFSIELFYEIFTYFQFHEVFNIFSNLNSQISAIIDNVSIMPVYLGLNGMNIEVTNFYYIHLSQANISNRLISLCVSDTLAIDNGLWLAAHISKFINLRHLSLIDIKRSSFELILNSLSPINSLIMFSIRFSNKCRAAYTYTGVPEGAYYGRIFYLFPSLRVCHLRFCRHINYTPDSQFILSLDRVFMPIQTSLLHVQSLLIRNCSSSLLSYLLEHFPQLKQLSYGHSGPWLPQEHPLRYYNNRVIPINKRIAPNLRRLNIDWNGLVVTVESITQLFDHDVLFSLTKFTLSAKIAGPYVLHNLLLMLSSRCLYSFDINWFVRTIVPLSDATKILSDTFQQLKGSVPVELELYLEENMYSIRAITVPRMDNYICVYSYLCQNAVHGRSRWPYNGRVFKSQLFQCNKIIMSKDYDQINEEFLSLSPPIICWHKITSINIAQPFNSTHLHLLFSQTINLRTLELNYRSKYDSNIDLKEETLIDILNDTSLCNILTSNSLQQLNFVAAWNQSNSLQQLNFVAAWNQSNLLDIAYLIVERLPHLQIIEVNGTDDQLIQMSHILISGLKKLTFLTIRGCIKYGLFYDKKLRDLNNSHTRSFRTEVPKIKDENTLCIWLS